MYKLNPDDLFQFRGANEEKEIECESLDEMQDYYVKKIKVAFDGYAAEDMVNDDGSVNMGEYLRKKGGPFKKEDVKHDLRLRDERMRDWAVYYYGLEDSNDDSLIEKKTREYEKKIESGNGMKLEQMIFVLMNKMLGPDYFVMHSADYDDVENGVDFVIVEADTGIVACGFDGVCDNEGGDRYQAKVKKLRRKSEKNGVNLKYGFTFKDGSVYKESLNNLPNFFLNMSVEDMKKLEDNMNKKLESGQKPSSIEVDVFNKMFDSLKSQLDSYVNNTKVNTKVRDNLQVFELVLMNINKKVRDL